MTSLAHIVPQDNPGDDESPFKRALWCAALATPLCLVLAGLATLAGLSRAKVGDEHGLVKVEYNRLDRFAAPTTLRVQLAPEAAGGKEVKLLVSHGYINGVRIRRIDPTPARVEHSDEGVVFVFDQGISRVIFQVEGVAYGALDGLVAVGDGARVGFKQYLLP